MTTEPSTSGPTLPWPIDAVVLGEVTWAARTVGASAINCCYPTLISF